MYEGWGIDRTVGEGVSSRSRAQPIWSANASRSSTTALAFSRSSLNILRAEMKEKSALPPTALAPPSRRRATTNAPRVHPRVLSFNLQHRLRNLGRNNLSGGSNVSSPPSLLPPLSERDAQSGYRNAGSTRPTPQRRSCPCERPSCTSCTGRPSRPSWRAGGPPSRRGTLRTGLARATGQFRVEGSGSSRGGKGRRGEGTHVEPFLATRSADCCLDVQDVLAHCARGGNRNRVSSAVSAAAMDRRDF